MDELKQTLLENEKIEIVWIAEDGAWYFTKPSSECQEQSRASILDEKPKPKAK